MPQASLFKKYKERESEVSEKVKAFLDCRGVYWWRNNTGKAKMKGFWVGFGKKGSADILALWPGTEAIPRGIFWSIELKRPGGAFEDEDQIRWLLDVRLRGGVGTVAESVEDVMRALEDPLYLPERYARAVEAYKRLAH